MRCPICTGESVVRARPAPWTFRTCSSCGVHFVDPMPDEGSVATDEHYTDVYYGAAAPRPNEAAWSHAAAIAADRRMARITAARGAPGRFLDVGTGTGDLLSAAKRAGWDVQGVEVSARAAEHARRTHDVPIHTGTVADAGFPGSSFDAVSLTHVLEHVPDPLALLAELNRILVAGGILNVAVPNARALTYAAYNVWHRARRRYGRDRFSCGLYPPEHLFAFDVSSLRETLTRAGFAMHALTVTGKGDPDHFPVVSWRGSGPAGQATRVLEWAGRHTGRGSIIDALARTAAPGAQNAPGA